MIATFSENAYSPICPQLPVLGKVNNGVGEDGKVELDPRHALHNKLENTLLRTKPNLLIAWGNRKWREWVAKGEYKGNRMVVSEAVNIMPTKATF